MVTDDGPLPLDVALLSIASTDAAKALLAASMKSAGHRVVARASAADEATIRRQLVMWISDPAVEVVIAIGADAALAQKALAPLVTEAIPGFADVFRWLSFEKLGTAAAGLSVQAARCGSTFVFALPDSPAALQLALDKLLTPQLDHRTKPSNLAKRLPRIATALRANVKTAAETYVVPQHAVATISLPTDTSNPYVTTGTIAVVGNLPSMNLEPHINVRAGRGGLYFLTALGIAAVAGAAAMAATIMRKNRDDDAALTRRAEQPLAAPEEPTVARAPAPVPAAPVRAEPPAARGSASSRPRTAVPKHVPKAPPAKPERAKPVEVPAALAPPPELDGMCDEVSCAANNYERECCTPFREPEKLSRAMIAAGINAIKPRAMQCAGDTPSTAKLRVLVGPDGRVTSAMIVDASESGFGQCVVEAVRDATFATTKHGGTFTYPFAFGE
jgi:molybdenum cofactor biosynthesis protein B